MKTKLLGFILLLTLLPGCIGRQVTIHSTAKTLSATALGVMVLEDITIELHQAGTIDRPTAEAIMNFSLSANVTGLEASKFIRNLNSLTLEDEARFEKIFITPILNSFELLMEKHIITIKDDIARERIETAIFLVRLSLQSLGDL